MDYDKEQAEFVYACVLTGFSPFLLESKSFYVKHLCPRLLFEAHSALMFSRESYVQAGLPTEYDLLKDAESKGLWSSDKALEIEALNKKILERSRMREKAILPSQEKAISAEIRQLEADRFQKIIYRNSLSATSIESKLAQDKRDYIVFASIYKSDYSRLWSNYEDFQNENERFIRESTEKYGQALSQITTPMIRYIARTTDARNRLKALSPSPSDSSIFLLELSQWCSFYTSIIELSDKPHDDIISNDKKLDDWVVSRRTKQVSGVNNTEGGYTSFIGATKEDMEVLGGVDRDTAIRESKNKG